MLLTLVVDGVEDQTTDTSNDKKDFTPINGKSSSIGRQRSEFYLSR